MTRSSSSHRRSPSSPHASKSKSSRPTLHRRGTSGANLSISKLGSGHSRGVSRSRNRADESEPDMAASFLNFCAMCERQITVPNNSLLYCSESCRRKDSCKPLSASMPSMSTTPPVSPPLSPRTIVAPMTPTRVPTDMIPSIRLPTDTHDAKSDLDPTEWKPVILAKRSPSTTSLASSDAWTYLSQFHGGNDSLLRRPTHRSTASLPALVSNTSAATGTLPSLTHTPSVASSISSTASEYLCSIYESSSSAPTQHRPLPRRHNPGSSTSPTNKGVELVVPHITTAEDHLPATMSDSGSILPASSAVWEDGYEKTVTAPLTMARMGVQTVQARAQEA